MSNNSNAFGGIDFTKLVNATNNNVNGVPNVDRAPAAESAAQEPFAAPSAQPPVSTPSASSPAQQEKKRSPGRPKGRPPKQERKAAAQTFKGIYFDNELHDALKLHCFMNKVTMSEYVNSATEDSLNRTYTCGNPACRGMFTLRATTDGEPTAPSCCPYCGGKDLHKKRG